MSANTRRIALVLCAVLIIAALATGVILLTAGDSKPAAESTQPNLQQLLANEQANARALYLAAQSVVTLAYGDDVPAADVFADGVLTDAYKAKMADFLEAEQIVLVNHDCVITGTLEQGVSQVRFVGESGYTNIFRPGEEIEQLPPAK